MQTHLSVCFRAIRAKRGLDSLLLCNALTIDRFGSL